MLKDRILAGTIAGMVATLIKDIPNLLLWKLGIDKVTYFALGSSTLISPKDSGTIYGWVLGIMVDIITGGTLGLIIVYLFKFTGREYWWYKGLVVGNIIWLFVLGLAVNFGASRIVPVDPVFRLTSLVEHQIFGILGAYLVVKWYPESGEQSEEQKQRLKLRARRVLIPTPALKKQLGKSEVHLIKPKKL